ncbi:MepB family protein [Arthrobacter psychrolactophilus]
MNIPESAQQQWQTAGLSWANAVPEPESADYCAHTLTLDERPAAFRVAKTTATKLGQFVTLWLRSAEGCLFAPITWTTA